MRYHMLTFATVAAAISLAGCGGKSADQGASGSSEAAASTSGSGEDQPADTCKLLTIEEVSAIIGKKVTQVQPTDPGGCDFKTDDDDGTQLKAFKAGGAHQMEIVHKTADLLGGMGQAVADNGAAGQDVATKLAPDKSAAPAIGDEAAWEANDTLAVRKGDLFVEASPPLMQDMAAHPGNPLLPKEEKRRIAQALAEKLLDKLSH